MRALADRLIMQEDEQLLADWRNTMVSGPMNEERREPVEPCSSEDIQDSPRLRNRPQRPSSPVSPRPVMPPPLPLP